MSLVAKRSIIAAGAIVNIAIFPFLPLYCSYRSVRRFESQLRTVDGALAKIADPKDTLIVAFDTSLLPNMRAVASERFIFDPLPQDGPSYRKYLESVESKLPPDTSRVVHIDRVDLSQGQSPV